MHKQNLFKWIKSFAVNPNIKAKKGQTGKSKISPEKTLIVYLSRDKNTKALAEIIHKIFDGTLIVLELEQPYPEDSDAIVKQVTNENATGFLPPLKTKIDNIEKYDFVFVGFPNWGMQLPPPMKSFLNQYDLSGKTIIPFNTNAGYGVGSGFRDVKGLCPNSTVLEGFSTRGGKESDGFLLVIEDNKAKQVQEKVNKWLQKIGLSNH